MVKTFRPTTDGFSYRSFGADLSTVDPESRSIGGIAATEQPVMMPDWERMEMVPEVLLMSGAKFPQGRSVPLLNNHNRYDAEAVIGSASELRNEGDTIKTRAVFSSAAEGIWTRVKEGHLRDLSVGYKIEKKRYIPAKTTERISGRDFTGPMNVVTSWTVREVSVTPIGADDQAKMRGLSANPFAERKSAMLTQEQRDKLIARGMPKDLDDAAQVAWAIDNPEVREVKVEPKKREGQNDGERGLTPEEIIKRAADAAIEAARKEKEAQDKAAKDLHDSIRGLCELTDMTDLANTLVAECRSIDEAREKIRTEKKKRQTEPVGPGHGIIAFGKDQRDKFDGSMRSAIVYRSMMSAFGQDSEKVEKLFPKEQRAAGWEDFKGAGLYQLAEEMVRAMGVRTVSLNRQQVAMVAMGFGDQIGIRSSAGFHTTGNFPNITLDAINKTLLAAYVDIPPTWRVVGNQGESVPDFKQIHRVRMSEAPNLDMWPGQSEPNEIGFRDEKESYNVEAYSNTVSFDWRSIVNDDMSALSRTPALMGRAASRTINAAFWSVVTSNPTMGDGQAFFLENATGNRFKGNLKTGAGAPSVTTLQILTNLLMQQTGVNKAAAGMSQAASDTILGITPRYIIGPSALSTTIKQLVLSAYDPAANQFMTYNTANELLPVIEPLLDASSTTAWYVTGDPRLWEGIEVTFLQGQESPVTRSWMEEESLAMKYNVLQSFGVKAIDFRSWTKHAGA